MVKLNYHLFLGINYLPVIFEDDHAPEKTNMFTRYCFKNLQLKPVLEEIESRSSRNEYSQLLAECHKLFCEQRLSLVIFFIGSVYYSIASMCVHSSFFIYSFSLLTLTMQSRLEVWHNNGYQILLRKKHCHHWLDQAAHTSCR